MQGDYAQAVPVVAPAYYPPPKPDDKQQAPLPGMAVPATAFNVQYQQAYPAKGAQTYAAQPGGQYPAQPAYPGGVYYGSSAPAQPSQDCCATPDWIFFGVGWVFPILWMVGALLPLCRAPRFKNRTVRGGWIANCVMTVLWIAALIAIIVVATRNGGGSGGSDDLQASCTSSYQCYGSEVCSCNHGYSCPSVCCVASEYCGCSTDNDCCGTGSCYSGCCQ